MGPTWQSVSPSIEGRIPTAPPGPRNDETGAQCAPTGGHAGPPLQNPLKCNIERRRGQAPALRYYITQGRRVKDAAPYRVATSDTRRTTGEHQGRRV